MDLLNQMLGLTDEFAQLHGGQWTYGNDTVFDPADTSGFRGMMSCGDDSRRFSVLIFGPGVSSPEDATTAAAEHFAEQGFTETNKFESSAKGNRYLMQTLTDSEGNSVVYQAGTKRSSIDVHSACSSHPGMAETFP
ncbi:MULTISPECIES: hypothetical protein [unclassified Arthrobacter]|uniref:hypothetical protein n=1 Tax=unclassified Arthrobacter TaxID=235627 RepID=UPI001D13AC05|nr:MULTISPECIES: hypothetical protein [unclassified Arthrobacter]MCC3274965.1 hypothetical protein [Arthrobacter sp. zg-Y20]MCC9177438.1 hypothetical protein [Arthrobacter sp. zg-Y750]MDK1315122.1 hypothetical protein [Arthrobacter sp. zg.Y20]WIB04967.1 hypothetical protein QNO06_10380 [Arthrobacter sp. zg-Y20]